MIQNRSLLLVPLLSLLPLANASAAEAGTSLWSMIEQGGWAMIPLAICSLALIYLAIHCLRETRRQRFGSDAFAEALVQACRDGQIDAALHRARQTNTMLGRTLGHALGRVDANAPETSIESVESELADSLDVEENAIGQWIHYLSVTANVAPMIGLLGTVSGMIGGFQTMASGGMGRPELFAGDIGEALITTATGLCIGIPAMVAHSYFNNRLNTQMVVTTRWANTVVDALRQATVSRMEDRHSLP